MKQALFASGLLVRNDIKNLVESHTVVLPNQEFALANFQAEISDLLDNICRKDETEIMNLLNVSSLFNDIKKKFWMNKHFEEIIKNVVNELKIKWSDNNDWLTESDNQMHPDVLTKTLIGRCFQFNNKTIRHAVKLLRYENFNDPIRDFFGPMKYWNVSNVTDMMYLFQRFHSF